MVLQVGVDIEELLIQAVLRPNAELQAIFGTGPIRIYPHLPETVVYPVLTVARLGGGLKVSHRYWEDRSRVQYDVWADTQKASWRAADKVRSALIAAQGTTFTPHGRIDAVTETLAPFDVQDPDTTRVHRVGEMLFDSRPLAVT